MKIKKLLGKLTACALSIGMTLSVCGIGCRNEWQTVSAEDDSIWEQIGDAVEDAANAVANETAFEAAISKQRSLYRDGEYFAGNAREYHSNHVNLTQTSKTKICKCSNCCLPGCPCDCGQFYLDDGVWKAGTCLGFACQIGYNIFGTDPYSWSIHTDVSNIKPGDIVYCNMTSVGAHAIFITAVDSTNVVYVDDNGSGPCMVKWDKTISRSELQKKINATPKQNRCGYIWHAANNNVISQPTITYSDIDTTYNKVFKNKGNGLTMDIQSGSSENCTNIGLYTRNASLAQQFKAVKTADKTYKLVAGTNSKLVLNPYAVTVSAGNNINIYTDENDATQKWKFEKVSDGYIIHNSANENLVIGRKDNNVELVTYNKNSNDQIWIMEDKTPTQTTTTAPVTTKAPVATTTTTTKATTTVTTTVTTTKTVATATLPADQIPFSGKGSENEPYLISCKADLIELSNLINNDVYYGQFYKQWYRQTADIDLGNEKWSPIAKRVVNGIDTGRSFSGHYDGDQHSITGLYVAETSKCAGLFGSVMGSTIENLAVYGSVTNTGNSTGGIIGEMCANNNRIENCCFIGDVTSTTNGVGGIVGLMWVNGQIKNCYHIGKVISKQQSAGGIAGYIGKVNNDNSFVIENCYHVGEVSGAENSAGSILGIVVEDRENTGVTVNIKNCFALNDGGEAVGSGKIDTKDVSLLNADLLRKSASLISDSFADSPDHDLNDGYPVFVWQLPAIVTTTTTTTTTTTEPTITTTTTTTTTTTYSEPQNDITVLRGDVDCDGSVKVADAVLLARCIAEDNVRVSANGIANAELTNDNTLTSNDLVALLNILAGA